MASQFGLALLVLACAVPLTLPAQGQTTSSSGTAPAGPRAAVRKPAPTGFEVLPWLSFEPVGGSLIRTPQQMDIAAREDQTFITVVGKKKKPDVGPRREDGYVPLNNPAAIPQDIPIGPTQSCSNGAYNTVAGQAATGADLIGALGGGRC